MPVVGLAADLQSRFRSLQVEWQEDSRYLSNTAQIAMLWPYQQIIGMGPEVVPLILQELQRKPDHWFWALRAITGEDPTTEDDRGDVRRSRDAWLNWGVARGLIADAV